MSEEAEAAKTKKPKRKSRPKGKPLNQIPDADLTEEGYPNDKWVFWGYDEKIESSRWLEADKYKEY